MRKLQFLTMIALALASWDARAQTDLSAYADANGYLDVQKLTCAQLANTWQEDANLLTAWYSGSRYEIYQFFVARPTAANSLVFWVQMFCNVVVVQALWWRRVRTNAALLWIISIFVNVGMWAERFVIIVLSLQREFLPSDWADYHPTWVDVSIFAGTIGFFMFLFLIFLRVLPFIPVAEVKELGHELRHEEGH